MTAFGATLPSAHLPAKDRNPPNPAIRAGAVNAGENPDHPPPDVCIKLKALT
jgi:hypothetical protein